MKTKSIIVSTLIIGAGSCYEPGDTLGLPCEDSTACFTGQACYMGTCVDPPVVQAEILCNALPEGAVGALYNFTPTVGGGSGQYGMWTASGLPPGLSIVPTSGLISGVPTTSGSHTGIEISLLDVGENWIVQSQCGELVINNALNANRALLEPRHCIDVSASREDMLALLDGGDHTEITCSPLANDSDNTNCPLGNGNGRMAPGISFDQVSCTHSGSVTGNRRGTWVWMVEISQSGFITKVPFCVTNGVDTFHDISVTVEGSSQSDLIPGAYEYNPNDDLAFGGGSHTWAIDDPACPGANCTDARAYPTVTCSPFDTVSPWEVTLEPIIHTETGLTHDLTATGPAPGGWFADWPFVASFEMSYCTSPDSQACDSLSNAQTQYHFDVVAYPVLGD